jgi:hypothetical protein
MPTPASTHPGAHAFPVSVKGVAVQGGRVLLLQNERNEWELPGGKLELREDVLSTDPPVVSNEHKQAALFAMSEIPDLVMPDAESGQPTEEDRVWARRVLGIEP